MRCRAAVVERARPATRYRGELLIAAACLTWGIDNNLIRKLSSADPVQVPIIKDIVAGSTSAVLALWLGASLPNAGLVGAGAMLGFLGI